MFKLSTIANETLSSLPEYNLQNQFRIITAKEDIRYDEVPYNSRAKFLFNLVVFNLPRRGNQISSMSI